MYTPDCPRQCHNEHRPRRLNVIAGGLTPPHDELLDAKEAARRLGMSADYLYRHARELPFAVRPGGRQLRFSARGIERYIHLRQGKTDSS